VLSTAPYIVFISDEQVNATLLPASNATNAYLYLAYNSTAREVQVISQPIYELLTEYNALVENFNNLNSEYNQLLATYGVLNETYSQELENYTQLQANFTRLNLTYEQVQAEFLQSQSNYTQVETTLNSLNSTYNALLQQWNLLNSTYNKLASENDSTRMALWIVLAVAIAFLIMTPLMTISYRRRLKDQKQLIEKYRTELERISLQNNARELFDADVRRRRAKIDEFQSKYGVEVRPRDTLEDVIRSLELKKKMGPES
jgi:DNA repair exonuclease SbcCD ATPase subunit